MKAKLTISTFLSVATTVAAFAFATAVVAQEKNDIPVSLSADEMQYNQNNTIVTAQGNVEISQTGKTLIADTVTYDRTNNKIGASGNVILHNSNGDVYFADKMEITGDLKNGMIEDFKAILADKSRFAAARADLVDDKTLTLNNAVYSPCKACEEDPTRAPLWQIKAVKVVHNREEKIIEYSNAWMEFSGIPVMYIPYLSYPDPTVKRKSGLLPPSFGGSSDLGGIFKQPVFYVIDDHSDTTITPIITGNGENALAGEYRKRFADGSLSVDGSFSRSAENNNLGHISAQTEFDIDRTWRWGLDANRTWGDTYMRRYGFNRAATLTSRAYIEGFRGKNYAGVEALSFQGLSSADTPKTIPVVAPLAQFSHQGEAGKYGEYTSFDLNLASLTRESGTDSTRISAKAGWTLPYTAPKGDVYKLSATLRTDVFNVSDQPHTEEADGLYDGTTYRVYPQVALDWRWPLAKRSGTTSEIIEPMAQAIVGPYGGNSQKMPNEDSQDVNFNDSSLFSTNRFAGLDKVESGPRFNYGIKWGLYGDGGGSTNLMIGQSYRLSSDDTFNAGSGLEDNFSDFVGMVKVSPNSNFNMLYRTRVDKNSYEFHSSELGMNGNAYDFNYGINYAFFKRQAGSEFAGREQINYSLGYNLTNNWNINYSGTDDLATGGGQRLQRTGLVYDDECFTFDASFSRTFYQDREIKPTDALMIRLTFKTIGEVSADQGFLGGL